TLLVDLLNYGSEAQSYFSYRTNCLANRDLSAEQLLLATQELQGLTSVESVTTTAGATGHFSSKSVVLGNEIVIKYYLTFDSGQSLDNVWIEFSYVTSVGTIAKISYDASEFDYDSATGRYAIRLRTIAAKDASQPVIARIYDGETLISDVFQYSIESYAYNQLNKETLSQSVRAIISSMMKYCKSANNYFTH
ncbi:MAG: hypothetical protein J5592_11230, partial [Clostridia bacterium]|nr:hypothetical protein [Clostridia bacterium]